MYSTIDTMRGEQTWKTKDSHLSQENYSYQLCSQHFIYCIHLYTYTLFTITINKYTAIASLALASWKYTDEYGTRSCTME